MKKLGLILSITMLLLSVNHSFADGEIKFIKNDYDKALKQAKAENKIIFVDVYATWCGPCKMLNQNTFTDDSLSQFFNQNFINLKIDGDTEEGIAFMEKYPVEAYPSLYFISAEEKSIKLLTGYMEADELLKEAEYIFHPEKSPYNVSLKKIESGKYNHHDLFHVIYEFVDKEEKHPKYDQYLDEYLSTFKPEDIIENDSLFVILYLCDFDFNSPYIQYISKHFDELEALYGEYVSDIFVSSIIVHTEMLAKKNDKAGLETIYEHLNYVLEGEELEEYKTSILDYYEELRTN